MARKPSQLYGKGSLCYAPPRLDAGGRQLLVKLLHPVTKQHGAVEVFITNATGVSMALQSLARCEAIAAAAMRLVKSHWQLLIKLDDGYTAAMEFHPGDYDDDGFEVNRPDSVRWTHHGSPKAGCLTERVVY